MSRIKGKADKYQCRQRRLLETYQLPFIITWQAISRRFGKQPKNPRKISALWRGLMGPAGLHQSM
jgi:hypothetical protein